MDPAHLKDSDRFMTDPAILAIVAKQWPGGIDLDPCHDPASFVKAALTYDIREGQNGAALPWKGRVWCNPPYSDATPFIARAQQHGAKGGRNEALVLINAATDTAYFQGLIFPFADLCYLSKRQRFHKVGPDGSIVRMGANPIASVVCYFGDKREAFYRAWAPHGRIVRMLPAPPLATKPTRARKPAADFKVGATADGYITIKPANDNNPEQALTAVRLGVVNTEAEFAALAEAATKLATKMGTDPDGALSDLVRALTPGSCEIIEHTCGRGYIDADDSPEQAADTIAA